MKIRDIEIKNSVIMAPMAGITNMAFRKIVKEFGAGLVYSEMVSDKAICYGNQKTIEMLQVDEGEHPVSIQLFGGEVESMVQAAKFIDEHSNCDIIDINCGCPVNKVLKANAGSKLLQNPQLIYDIVSNIVSRNNINSMSQADSASGYTVMTADQSGIVSYSYDGMESYTQDDMTPELFSARNYEKTQLSAGMKIDSASPAYKLIYDDNWQIVVCPTADQYKRLKELDTVNLQLQRDNITVSADVSTFQKDGTDYVSFSLSNYMVRYCNDRYIDIEIIWDNHDGLKIPKSSIVSKNFYRIPADYLQTEEESSESGFYSVDNDETVFIKPVIYAQNKEYCYVDCADIAEGTVLKKPSSDETYTIGETEALKGVYNINKGYAMFRLIDILYEYGDYCIVSDKTDYGVTLYDHIILNGSSVKENDIIY